MWKVALSSVLIFVAACSSEEPEVERIDYPLCAEIDGEPLHARAARFDAIGPTLHMPAGQDLMHSVFVASDLTTFDRVRLSDNSGFWTSTYTASQAFRWAVTKDPEALANVKRALQGQYDLMRITGVPGLYARSYVNLDLSGFPTEQELLDQYPDCDLSVEHCKRFQRGTGEFANYMFKNDVSRDEYAGHQFALGVVGKLVDDPDVQRIVKDMSAQVATHLIDNDLTIVDIDGEVTTFGYLNPTSFSGFPGFNAVQVLSFIKVAAYMNPEQPRFESFYRNCLLHEDLSQCEKPDLATNDKYQLHLEDMGLDFGCKTNWNNHNMAQLAMFDLIWLEEDERTKSTYQRILQNHMWDQEDARPMKDQQHTLFTFFREVNRHRERNALDETAVNDAVCVLKKFPEVKYQRAVDNTSYPEVCTDRKDRPMTDQVIPFDERPMDNFMWKLNPYLIEQVPENRQFIEAPDDFLLAYWLGRYFDILTPES